MNIEDIEHQVLNVVIQYNLLLELISNENGPAEKLVLVKFSPMYNDVNNTDKIHLLNELISECTNPEAGWTSSESCW